MRIDGFALHSSFPVLDRVETVPARSPQGASWIDRQYGPDRAGPAIIGHRGATLDLVGGDPPRFLDNNRDGERNVDDWVRENSIEALRFASESGADGIELDIHFLGDGTPVVVHDPEHQGQALADMTAADLGENGGDIRLDSLHAWTEAYAALDNPGLNVFAEFKGATFPDGFGNVLKSHLGLDTPVDDALALLQGVTTSESLVAASFDLDVLAGLHRADPSLRLGLFADRPPKDGPADDFDSVFDQLAALDAAGIALDFVALNETNLEVDGLDQDQVLQRLDDAGYGIVIGHTREEFMRDPRVDAIISNNPYHGQEVREDARPEPPRLGPGVQLY